MSGSRERRRVPKLSGPERTLGDTEKDEKRSSYKNAMIGTISYYNTAEVIDFKTQEQVIEPCRINTTYIGRMPERAIPYFQKGVQESGC